MRERLLRAAWPYWLLVLLATAAASWLPLLPSLAALLSPAGWERLAEPRLAGLFGRSMWMAALAAGLATLAGVPLAALATRAALPGAPWFELLLPLPLLLPPLLLAQSWHGLTGMDGAYAAVLCLGLVYAPLPALLVARALTRQPASAHESALLSGGRRLAGAQMLVTAAPAALLGGALAFLFAASDFSVPDYMSWLAERKFFVYSFEIFNHGRDGDPASGAAAAAPMMLVTALLLYACLALGERSSGVERAAAAPPPRLQLGRACWPLFALALLLAALYLLLPLGQLVYDTGKAGPAASASWLERSGNAFRLAVERGRGDLLRSLQTALLAAGLVLVLAPFWARALLALPPRRQRLLLVLLALPLLAPSVGFALGAVVIYNRDLFGGLYDSPLLPPLLLAGRWLPVAVFLLAERLRRVPASQEEAAALAGCSYGARVFRYRLGAQWPSLWLAAGIVAALAVREIDLAVLIPAANASAAVRYYNALHGQRDNFVAAFGILIALVLFLPLMCASAARSARSAQPRHSESS